MLCCHDAAMLSEERGISFYRIGNPHIHHPRVTKPRERARNNDPIVPAELESAGMKYKDLQSAKTLQRRGNGKCIPRPTIK